MSSNRDPESDHFGKASDHCLDTCGRRADLGWLAGRAIRRSASRHTCNCGEAERLRTAKSLGQHDHPIFCAEGALHALCRFRPAVEVVRGWVSVWSASVRLSWVPPAGYSRGRKEEVALYRGVPPLKRVGRGLLHFATKKNFSERDTFNVDVPQESLPPTTLARLPGPPGHA